MTQAKESTYLSARSLMEDGVQMRIDPTRVALVHPPPVRSAERQLFDVAPGVVVVLPGVQVDPTDRADHLGAEQDVVHADDVEQQIDARLVVDAGVEVDVA